MSGISCVEWRPLGQSLAILIGTALCVQAFVAYWGQRAPELSWGSFFYATALARTLVPLACTLGVLKLSWSRLGFGRPHVPRSDVWPLLAAIALGTGTAVLLLGMDSYQAAYGGLRSGEPSERLLRWALFVTSTTLPWEILHRGFLLHGTRELCLRGGIRSQDAAWIAVLFTMSFEVIFHFTKPPLEALGLVIGSPLLSYLAFRYRSIWISTLGHLGAELLWFLTVWL